MTTPLKPSQLLALLTKAIPARLPVLVTGAPGVGKTMVMKAAARACNAVCVIFHPVVSDPTDFKGMPWVIIGTDGKGKAVFIPFGDLEQLMNATGLTLCFIDDLGQGSPAVQAAIMQLVLARQINGHLISDNVVFAAATNRRADRAGVSGILEPLKSRFATIVELVTDMMDWCKWAASAGIAPEVIGFIRFRPKLLCDFKPTADMTNSPCPRTWEAVSNWLKLGLSADLMLPTIEGAVGEGAAVEFIGYLKVWRSMVSPDQILMNPDTAAIPTEVSAMCAVASALAERVKANTMERFCRYLERLRQANFGDYASFSMKAATARDPKLTQTGAYIKAVSGPLGVLMV